MQQKLENSILLKWIENHIGNVDAELSAHINAAFINFRINNTTELSNKVFNQIHNKEKQKKLGITYTPQQIRKEIISRCFNAKKLYDDPSKIKICDPACGSGLFIIDIIEEFLIKFGNINEISKSIYFYDIDKTSVAITLTNIYCHLIKTGHFDESIRFNAKCIDFFDVNERFDYIITNPPYVKLQNIPDEQRLKLRNKYPEIFTGSIGLASLFLMKIHDSLRDNGITGLITQNNIFTSNSGKILRKLIQSHILNIDNFGSEKIFDEVTAYTCLLYLTKEENKEFGYRKINTLVDFKENTTTINSSELKYEKWRLGTDSERKNLKNMESKGLPLGDVCRIWVGIATQFDKAFTVHKSEGIWYGLSPDGTKMQVENSIVKKLIKISDFNSSKELEKNSRGVIYPYEIKSKKAIAITEESLIIEYPNTYTYLKTWKNELLLRDKGKSLNTDWFKWGRTQSMIPVSGKLLTKTFSHGPSFFFDESDALFSNGYALTIKTQGFLLEFVEQVLNSDIFWEYAKLTSFEIGGDYQCYQKNFIERFCIPKISVEKQMELINSRNITEYLKLHYEIV